MMPETPNNQLTDQRQQGYAFIANAARLIDASSYTLAPGYELRRATRDEIEVLRVYLKNFLPTPPEIYEHLWECRLPVHGTREQLPEANWRYFVVGFTGTNATINSLKAAFDLAPLELEIIFTIAYSGGAGPAIIWNSRQLFQVIFDAPYNISFFRDVRVSDLAVVRKIHEMMQRHDHALIDMNQVARQFSELKTMPQDAKLRFLGYFAILESMLTHPPKPFDPYDSITRQVVHKIALLDNRWSPKLDYTPFEQTLPENIWKKMYAFRSKLAHGGNPNFNGEYRALQNHAEALRLVRDCAKAVARQVLIEPQLLLDLREC